MKNKTAVFIGHKECHEVKIHEIKEAIIQLIEQGVDTFLCGGMGSFDWKCAEAVYDLKKRVSANKKLSYYSVFIVQNLGSKIFR